MKEAGLKLGAWGKHPWKSDLSARTLVRKGQILLITLYPRPHMQHQNTNWNTHDLGSSPAQCCTNQAPGFL